MENNEKTINKSSGNSDIKEVPKQPTVTTDTSVTTVTTDTSVTPYLPVTVVACDSEVLKSIFGEETSEQILKVMIWENKPLTTQFLADRLGKTEQNIRQALSRKRHLFAKKGQRGQICHNFLSQLGIEEIEDRISSKLAEKALNEAKEKEQKMRKNEANLRADEVTKFARLIPAERTERILTLDFQKILDYDPKLADYFLEKPEEFIKNYKNSFDFDYEIKIIGLPNSINVPIEKIRKEHLNRIIIIEGRVTSFGEVKPVISQLKFECPSCGNLITMNQNYRDGNLKEPSRCSCGRRGKFNLDSRIERNCCFLQFEDLQEKTDNPHSQRIRAAAFDILTEPENIKVFSPGNEVRCVGILKEVPIVKYGQKTLFLNWILEIYSAELIDKDVDIEEFTEEEKKRIADLSKDISEKGMEVITNSFAPDVHGYEKIKEALILQLCNRRNDPKNRTVKNKSNILLIGDPGTAKSVMCDFAVDITPGARKAVGGGSSAVGITASVVKEEESLGGYRVEPGAMVLSKELLFIDELNNLQDEDKPKLQEGMESQSVTINKANLHVKMKVTAGIISAANPIGGNFTLSGEKTMEQQFNIPTPILNRFDSIFVITDNVDEELDSKIAHKMIRRHQGKLEFIYDKDFLKKFFIFIRTINEPTISDECSKIINKIYCLSRKHNNARVKLNARFLNGLTRMCIASAKLRQSKEVELKDIERCINILAETEYQVNPYVINKLHEHNKNSIG